MKKSYFFSIFACLMLIATTATAQVSSVTDLFGKYRFTATMELFDNSYAGQLSADCDVVISEDVNYMAKIVGFAGSSNQQNINDISTEKEMLKVTNPNTPQLWTGLYLANENGDYPYSVWENGEEKSAAYGPVYYTYDPATKLITVPDFTVVNNLNHETHTANLVAKFTNVKMTLVEAETVEVNDISGDWNFQEGTSNESTMEGSVIPTEFTISLVKTGDDNRNYTATMNIEGYSPVNFPATFDGNSLLLAFDNTYLDEANGIRFAYIYGSATSGSIEFKKNTTNDNFTNYSGFALASDTIGKAADGVTDSLYVNSKYHQWYVNGTLKRPAAAPDFTWDGTYTVKVASSADVIPTTAGSTYEWPTEFQMVIQYWEAIDSYYVTEFLGFDLYNLNGGGFPLVPASDGSASITLNGGNYGVALLKSNGDGTYLTLTNQNGVIDTPLKMTLGEDGTVTMESFFVQNYDFSTGSFSVDGGVFYQNLTAEKYVEPAFDWVGTYALTSTVDSDDATAYPESFYVTVVYNESADMYLVTEFAGQDVTGINNGGLLLTLGEDGKSATLKTGNIAWQGEPGGVLLKLRDANGETSDITLTLNEDGTISASNFTVAAGAYGDDSMNLVLAEYSNVNLVKDGEIVEPEPEPEPDPVDYTPTYTGTRTYNNWGSTRSIQTISLASATHGQGDAKNIYSLTSSEQSQDYVDLTSGEVWFVAAPGEEVSLTLNYDGTWIHHYVYIDADANGFVAGVDADGYTPTGDLVAYSFYNNDSSSDASGWNSTGAYISGDNRAQPSIPSFVVPTEEGTYRMRIKQDWCNIDPMGDADGKFGDFKENGGQIVDIRLVVTTETSIEDVVTEGAAVEYIYDITGRKIEEITVPGIYIVNGKKVLVK